MPTTKARIQQCAAPSLQLDARSALPVKLSYCRCDKNLGRLDTSKTCSMTKTLLWPRFERCFCSVRVIGFFVFQAVLFLGSRCRPP